MLRSGRCVAIVAAVGFISGTSGCTGAAHSASPVTPAVSRGCRPTNWSGETTVPKVAGISFQYALSLLYQHHLLVSVSHFPSQRYRNELESYSVVAQFPRAGSHIASGSAVSLQVALAPLVGDALPPLVPKHHPTFARVPDLVGMDWRQTLTAVGYRTGVFVQDGAIGRLSPAASACGLNAFVVTAQSPSPGTLVRWGGILPGGRVIPQLATVSVTLASRPPAHTA